ncbi:hypothetical protein ACRRTK_009697 [Alexandromys fortis]
MPLFLAQSISSISDLLLGLHELLREIDAGDGITAAIGRQSAIGSFRKLYLTQAAGQQVPPEDASLMLLETDDEENLTSPAKTESGEALSLLLGSREASSPVVQVTKTEREGGSSTEMEDSVIHYLLHEDERDFKEYVNLGPVALKLLRVEGKKMPIHFQEKESPLKSYDDIQSPQSHITHKMLRACDVTWRGSGSLSRIGLHDVYFRRNNGKLSSYQSEKRHGGPGRKLSGALALQAEVSSVPDTAKSVIRELPLPSGDLGNGDHTASALAPGSELTSVSPEVKKL